MEKDPKEKKIMLHDPFIHIGAMFMVAFIYYFTYNKIKVLAVQTQIKIMFIVFFIFEILDLIFSMFGKPL